MFKTFGSVRLVQEVTRSNQSSSSPSLIDSKSNQDNLSSSFSSSSSIDNIIGTNNRIKNDIYIDNTTASTTTTSTTKNNKNNENQQQIKEQEINMMDDTQKLQQHMHQPTTPSTPTTSTTTHDSTYKPRDIRNVFNKPQPQKYNNTDCHHDSFSSTQQQPNKEDEERQKSKSQKLLCLWCLPIVTRYLILIACFISTLDFLNIIDLSCSAPSYVIYRLDFKNLILSPFLFDWRRLPSLVLFGWNIVILGLFEKSLVHMIGGTTRFIELLVGLFTCVSGLRVLLGFIFSRSTGWALPCLFFSNSIHECSQGLAPFLFALVVVQSLGIDDNYILIYGQHEESHKLIMRKVTLHLIMCLVNYTTRNILWWSLSGLLTGFLATIVLSILLAREKREDAGEINDASEYITLERYRHIPLWRLIWSATKKSAMMVLCTFPILMAWNYYYIREIMVTSTELNTISQDRYLFTFVFMTAPRRGDPDHLTRTIESYLENWPEHPTSDSPYRRMQAIIYTHFSNHAQYDLAQDRFSKTIKGQRYLRWVREEGGEMNQRLHIAKALDYATETYQSTYYAVMEDDFPVCGIREWHEIKNVIYKAEKNVPSHCGVFVGTGGSGLFLKPDLARLTSQLMLDHVDIPADIIMQKCLMGQLPECASCADSLVSSKNLLMYHIGYNTSTSQDRSYNKDQYQCGWRHPFNGNPSVITL